MSAQSLEEIRGLLDAYGLSPKKSLGQNFLIDKNLVGKLVDESGVSAGDLVLEVGPGTGTLTGALLDRGCEVVACELDDGLAGLVADRYGSRAGFTLVRGDCLDSKRALSADLVRALGGREFRLVANLPYQAATPLMMVLLVDHPGCVSMSVTIQKEVADRLCAGPGSKAYGSISVLAGCTARLTRLGNLPRECFWPRPRVVSSMVRLDRLGTPLTADAARLASFCRVVFAGRRKQLGGLLRSLGLTPACWPENIDPAARIEALSPAEIEALAACCGVV